MFSAQSLVQCRGCISTTTISDFVRVKRATEEKEKGHASYSARDGNRQERKKIKMGIVDYGSSLPLSCPGPKLASWLLGVVAGRASQVRKKALLVRTGVVSQNVTGRPFMRPVVTHLGSSCPMLRCAASRSPSFNQCLFSFWYLQTTTTQATKQPSNPSLPASCRVVGECLSARDWTAQTHLPPSFRPNGSRSSTSPSVGIRNRSCGCVIETAHCTVPFRTSLTWLLTSLF